MRISDWSSDVCSSDLAVADVTFVSLDLTEHEVGLLLPAIALDPAFQQRDANGKAVQAGSDVLDFHRPLQTLACPDRKSVVWGKSVSVSVDLGGRRIIKNKIQNKHISKTINKLP